MPDDLNTPLQPNALGVPSFARARTRALRFARLFSRARAATLSPAARWRHAWLALAGLTLGAISLIWHGRAREQPRTEMQPVLAREAEPPPLPPPPPLRLADGSTVELHGSTSTLKTDELSSGRMRLRLSGGARFDVVPNGARSFVVSNAQVLVRVIGTTFSVDPEGERTRVAVERGRVQIIWWNGATVLRAGEAAIFPPENEPAFAPSRSLDLSREAASPKRTKRATKRRKARSSSGSVRHTRPGARIAQL